MAASQASLVLRNSTDAEFRLWGKFISDGLAAGGWTKMDSDINWASVTAPAQNTFAGYEVWKSPDETGLTNFYLKLQYGSNNNASKAPAIEWTVGWGYAGSGSSLSGVVSTAVDTRSGSAAPSSTSRLCSIAAGAGYVVINLGNGEATVGRHSLVIERNRNSSLAAIDEIMWTGGYWVSANTYRTGVLSTTFEYPVYTSSAVYTAPDGNNAVQNQTVGLAFISGFRGIRTAPFKGLLGVYDGSLGGSFTFVGAPGQTVTVTVDGASHTYIIGSSAGTVFYSLSGYAPLHRYE